MLPIVSAVFSLCVFLVVLLNMTADGPIWMAFVLLAAANLPTAIFLIVCRVTRRRLIQKKNMEKMNIQDLE